MTQNIDYQPLANGTKIQIGRVEGSTNKKGAKQNRVYTIIGHSDFSLNPRTGKYDDLRSFHKALDEKGNTVTLWDVWKDMSSIGISRVIKGRFTGRYTFCRDFTIINN